MLVSRAVVAPAEDDSPLENPAGSPKPDALLREPAGHEASKAGGMPAPEHFAETPIAEPATCEPVSADMALTRPGSPEPDWSELEAAVAACRRCTLCESRRNPVFGVGQRSPRWLIVGEAPGEQEDRAGEPFVGPAGQLLDAMLHAVGANRVNDVFIVNVLKCRPPRNRDPLPEEISSCRPYLEKQIQLLKPELILTVGRFAAQAVLQSEVSVGQLRGQVHQLEVAGRRIPTVVSYHPAYLLRRPEEKAKAWQDLCLARSVVKPVVNPAD